MAPQSPQQPPSFDDLPWDRLARLLAGELGPEEAAHLQHWLAADPRREAIVAELRELWAVTEPGSPSRDPGQVLAAIRRRDESSVHDIATHHRYTTMPSVRHPRPLWRALAAAAIVALVAGAWWMAATVGSGDGRSVRVASAMIEQRTMRGQRLMVTLSDGSTVMLGPESVLRYAPTYGAASRTVELDGEAYFDVLHDDARPFLVKAGNAIARDIGTRFVVQARRGAAVAVAVQEGRVALGGADRPMPDAVLLGAHEVGRVDAMGHAVRRREASLDRYLGWTEGRLVFEATPLATVAAELSRWYDVDVELADSGLADLQLTATFHNEPITTVLPMVQASLGLQLVGTRGRHYVLSRR